MYTQRVLVAVLLAMSAAVTSARVVEKRQLGGIRCNVARLRIVGALGDTNDAVAQIQDPATQDAASTALDQAQGGISQIAQAIFAGEDPPAAGRDQVEAGLTAAGTLSPAATLTDAQASLDDAVKAGQDVVANC